MGSKVGAVNGCLSKMRFSERDLGGTARGDNLEFVWIMQRDGVNF